ncbi:MAG: FAD-dependent oxidoreductase [Thermoanaerobaculia bacterium]
MSSGSSCVSAKRSGTSGDSSKSASRSGRWGSPSASGAGWLENRLARAHLRDWSRDPFARGAYSYALVGGAEAARQLARPISAALFFAGEATDPEQNGTVSGAIASGRRAAAQILLRPR